MANPRPKIEHLKPYRFRPGSPGGPGRPPGIVRQEIEQVLAEKFPKDPQKRTKLRLAVEALVRQAMKGSVPAFVALADRVDGKPSQAVTGEGGGPMRVHVTIERIGGGEDEE